jgi:uncharacterized protein YkwD
MNLPILKRFRGLILLIGLAGGFASAASDRPASSELLFVMPAKGFFAIEDVGRPLDPQRVDDVLLSAAIFHETNEERRLYDKRRLTHSPQLERAAQMHAASMVRHDFFAHVNPKEPELKTLEQRIQKAGMAPPGFIAENIATQFGLPYRAGVPLYRVERAGEKGFSYSADGPLIPRHTYRSFAAALLEEWMASPEHRQNILADRAEFMGAACTPKTEDSGMAVFTCVEVLAAP